MPAPPSIRLDPGCRRAMVAHVRDSAPLEACGLLIGSVEVDGQRIVHRAVPLTNAAPSPRTEYVLAPEEHLDVERQARSAGLEVVGVYHSHPTGEPKPSERDRLTAMPHWSYLIVAGTDAQLRSWRLRDDGSAFDEEALCAHSE